MLINERRQRILEYVEKEGKATVKELASMLYVSEPTLRRDITAMEHNGTLRKVYGGIMPKSAADREIPMLMRQHAESEAKARMARRAVELVKDGDVIILDGSSSAMAMVSELTRFKELIVITSGAKTAVALAQNGIRTFCTGGQMITRSFSYVGQQAQDFVSGINADILFFSCHGLNDAGQATDLSMDEVNLRKTMLAHAKKKVLLCDKSKLGQTFFYNLCTVDDIDCVISE